MSMQTVGRLSQPVVTGTSDCVTVSGSKGLLQREDLLFEVGAANQTGVDLPGLKNRSDRLGGVRRAQAARRPRARPALHSAGAGLALVLARRPRR